MQRRKLEELDLLDDFLFFTLVNHPEYGEQFSRKLLKIILGKQLGKLKIVPQKVYYGSDTDKHGARLDVYLEEDVEGLENLEDATICDIEPEKNDKESDVKALPKRVRFYHSKIDVGSLKTGEDYSALKNVIVILITPFDPFGYNHMIYTIRNGCVEMPEMPYDDGARTLFLYTKGEKGNPTKELRELLEYMELSRQENAKNDTLKEIHKMVENVKQDSEVSLAYMRMMKREEYIRKEALAEINEMKLMAEKEAKRAKEESKRADEESKRADEESKRADEESKRADLAEEQLKMQEQEIARLKALLGEKE